ncbi:MAG: formate dehydrogenase accessory sulfurtransferase FdhD [Bacteroidia bacterium]|nr:formate dehydrogenase accessory sulfurtransferase FdhD [Bacteroidia bacterium]
MRAVNEIPILRVSKEGRSNSFDEVAIEEPLEIRVNCSTQISQPLAVTMRTPAHDIELGTGFLFTEGIISSSNEILSAMQPEENRVDFTLDLPPEKAKGILNRQFYMTSSCGVCGKSSLDAVKVNCKPLDFTTRIQEHMLYNLPDVAIELQETFRRTGGLHASFLFDTAGRLLIMREDVGRHNALDKVVGASLRDNAIPLHDRVLLLSGRASFELIQKAALAGIQVVAGIGAPSSLAVELARSVGITLVGFLKSDRFNVYSAPERIVA